MTASQSSAAKPAKIKVMVSLCGFDASAAASTSADVAVTDYAAKRAQFAQRKTEAKRLRDEAVAWLKNQKESGALEGSFRRVSDVTVFGTFTLEATPDVITLLERAPHVESVTPAAEMSMTILGVGTE